MSGGFFRGTSADQDTRFSNKHSKLLKSQKFAPELDHLVDITKVKMDVVKPWIAKRVTEILGFEDEVLINFIYGLLDGKDINGKEVQIQLTGFMEKNTGKFMRELWGLLLSAQNNASGVPQQFLDAKEEEIRKRKEESDRITLEIQKKKEVEQEKPKKMDIEVDMARASTDAFDPTSKHLPPRASSVHKEEDKDAEERNGSRGKNRHSKSPHSADRAPSSELSSPRSISKSFSNSRSYSENKSRSMSRSPPRRRSISPERRHRSPRKRSMSPRRRNSPRRPRSPLRRRSPQSRRRSTSRSWRRSSSIGRRRSPSLLRRRSPSPVRRRSPSPVRRRSPSPLRRDSPSFVRRRSPSPVRRRSPPPMRRRSPSPRRRRSPSPVQRRLRRRSPTPRRRSPSPLRRRSPSPPRRRSPSPVRRRSPPPRSPKQRRRSPMRSPRQRNRSRSPYRSRSPVYRSRRSLSRDREIQTNGVGSRRIRDDYGSQRFRGKRSPVRHTPERGEVELSGQERKASDPGSRRPPISLRSPQREPRNRSDIHQKVPVLLPSPEKSPTLSESSPHMEKVISRDDKSPSESPVRVTRERMTRADSASPVRQRRDNASRRNSSDSSREEISHARGDGGHISISPRKIIRHSSTVDNNNIPSKNFKSEEYSQKRFSGDQSGEAPGHRMENLELRKKDRDRNSEKASVRAERPGSSLQQLSRTVEVIEYGPGRIEGERSTLDHVPDEQSFGKKRPREGSVRVDKTEALQKSMKRVDHNNQTAASDSDSGENEKYRLEDVEKRKRRRSNRHQMASDDDASYDSKIDARKDAKRRRKEEKRLRKEEKRRRREERHRKREERRAGRLKAKSVDTITPSDIENNQNVVDDVASKRESHPSDIEETETEQKKLEIELRKKALESLRAKKAINP